jgi:hypothetical protein
MDYFKDYNKVDKYNLPYSEIVKEDKESEYIVEYIWKEELPEKYFDFIYIDANHSYDFVKEDILGWYPKLKVNGILSGHDYLVGRKGRDGVKRAVDEFCSSLKLKLYITGGNRRCPPSWYFVKENFV